MKHLEPSVYLDYAASAPLDSRALQEMLPYLTSEHGNASSLHACGRRARAAIDLARDRVAALMHCEPGEICFTSGGTEADNLAVLGAALRAPEMRRSIVISSIEHHAVLNPARRLAQLGYSVSEIPVSRDGALDLRVAQSLINDRVALVSVMTANNETGQLLPVRKIARMARAAGALMHTDAVQAAALRRLDPDDDGLDLVSISAHKMCGPKGAGALRARRGVRLEPILYGGAHERERRAGTENVAAIAGFGKAAEMALTGRSEHVSAVEAAREAFVEGLGDLSGLTLNAGSQPRLPSILNYAIAGVDAELLLIRLDAMGIAISSGAACASGSREPSHVLVAMGLSGQELASSVRVSFGWASDPDSCREAGRVLAETVREMRDVSAA